MLAVGNKRIRFERRSTKVVMVPQPRGVRFGQPCDQIVADLLQQWSGNVGASVGAGLQVSNL
jgi:hypothetical protein